MSWHQEIFRLFHGEFDKITDSVLKDFGKELIEVAALSGYLGRTYILERWKHDDEKLEWSGKLRK